MKSLLVLTLLSFVLVSGMSLAYADHSEVKIEAVSGSGAPGCETTSSGCYTPNSVTVDVGGKVIMSNPDTAAHTFTAGSPNDGPTGEFDTGLIMAGSSFEYSPETVGEVPYFCMVHPWMKGLIIVSSIGNDTPNPEPIPNPITDNDLASENRQLKNEIMELKLENRQLKNEITSLNSEIDSLKDQIVSMTKEFVNALEVLHEWFVLQLG